MLKQVVKGARKAVATEANDQKNMLKQVVKGSREAVATGANDVIVVKQTNGEFMATPIVAQVGKAHSKTTMLKSREGQVVKIFINDQEVITANELKIQASGKAAFHDDENPDDPFSIHLLSQCWANANLKPGLNPGEFRVEALGVQFKFDVFLFDQNDRLVLTDIDGTITVSDIKGHVLPRLGLDADHKRVVECFDVIGRNGYKMVYMTARSIGLSI